MATTVRVLTYNVHGGGRRRELAAVVRRIAPDVAVVNEAPKWPLLWRWQCRRLSRDWGLTLVAGGRPGGGNLVLAAPGVRVLDCGSRRLPQPVLRPIRGIASARLRVGAAQIGVVGCHLSLRAASRRREVELVVAAADEVGDPVVVAGDLNERPGGPSWRRLRHAGFVDGAGRGDLTFPADRPDRRIDALLVRGGLTVREHRSPDLEPALLARASDHLPVTALLEPGAQAPAR